MKTKVCTKCGIDKPLSEYANSKRGKSGKTSICKVCRKRIYTDSREYKTCRIEITHEMYFKTCPVCKKLKPISMFSNSKSSKDGKCSHCKKCDQFYSTGNYKRTRIKIKYPIYFKACFDCGKLKPISEYSIRCDSVNNDIYKTVCKSCIAQQQRKRGRKAIERLSDGYIKSIISKSMMISIDNIPEGLMELKRSQIKLYRAINGVCR